MKLLFILINTFIALKCFSYENSLEELSKHIIPIGKIEAGNGFDDLKELRTAFNDIDVIALGESTHGTKEFFQFKHRLLEFLIQEMGFRIFVMEASYTGCLAINDYILHGKGNRDEVLEQQGYWIWNTREMAEILDWMRAYNSMVSNEEKVQLFGIDLKITKDFFIPVEEYFMLIDPQFLPYATAAIQLFKEERSIETLCPHEIFATRSDLLKVIEYMYSKKNFFIDNSSKTEYEKVVMILRTLVQNLDVYGGSQTKGIDEFNSFILAHPELLDLIKEDPKKLLHSSILETHQELGTIFTNFPDLVDFINMSDELHERDFHMAENVLSLLKQQTSDARMVLWAHNGHVSFSNDTSMGHYLKRSLGQKYYSLGLIFNKGSFHAVNESIYTNRKFNLSVFTIPLAPEGSFPWFCSTLRADKFILDFRSLRNNQTLFEWILTPLSISHIGASFPENASIDSYFHPKILPQEFDGIVFFEQTSCATPNWKE